MIPVGQSRRFGITGDCLSACVASLLELDLRDVPDFAMYEDTEIWWKAAQDFCFLHGYQLWRVDLAQQTKWYHMPAEPLVILVGPSFETKAPHACVGYIKNAIGQEIEAIVVHDPLGGEGLDGVDAVMFLVPVNPARQARMGIEMARIENICNANSSAHIRINSIRKIAAELKTKASVPAAGPKREIFYDEGGLNGQKQD